MTGSRILMGCKLGLFFYCSGLEQHHVQMYQMSGFSQKQHREDDRSGLENGSPKRSMLWAAHLHECAGVHDAGERGNERDVLGSVALCGAVLAEVAQEVLHVLQAVYVAPLRVLLLELVHQVLHCRPNVTKVAVHVPLVELVLPC